MIFITREIGKIIKIKSIEFINFYFYTFHCFIDLLNITGSRILVKLLFIKPNSIFNGFSQQSKGGKVMRVFIKGSIFLFILVFLIISCQDVRSPMEVVENQQSQEAVQSTIVVEGGTETLGDPAIPIGSGSGIVEGGVGLATQPATLNIYVPGTVVQTLLYWSGGTIGNNPGDNTIIVNETNITGDLIGGPAYFYSYNGDYYFSNYRADITALGLVSSGNNSLSISGMDFGALENSGAGILVIYDDGSGTADIQIKDGLDLAFFNFPEPRQTTIPQIFNFTASDADRNADLVIFAGSVAPNRPNRIRATANGTDQFFDDLLGSNDGNHWDSPTISVLIPAGATQLEVECISFPSFDPLGASLNWIVGAFVLETPPPPGYSGCTPGFWRNHFELWPASINPGDDFDTTFGVNYFNPDITLGEAIWLGGGGKKKIARHGTAALINAMHPDINYPFTVAEVINYVQAGDVEMLVLANELSSECPCQAE